MINFTVQAAELVNPTKGQFDSIADIVNAFVTPILTLAGIALFLFMVIAGFKYMTSGDDPKAKDSAKGQLTSAVIGFTIIFASYWIVQIVAAVFGVEAQILAP
jgi:hypothetical protein